MIGIVRDERVNVFIARAVGEEEEAFVVRRPGDAVIVGGMIGDAFGFAAIAGHQENLALNDNRDVLFIRGKSVLAGALGGDRDLVGIGLVVGGGVDVELAALAFCDVVKEEIEAAFVDDGFAAGAEACSADAFAGVRGQLHRAADGAGDIAADFLFDDVRDPETVADVVKSFPVGTPHRGIVLAIVGGDAAMVAAIGIAQPEVVVRGAAIVLAIPRTGAADVGERAAAGAHGGLAAFGDVDLARRAADHRNRPERDVCGVLGATSRCEKDVFAVWRPAGGEIVGGIVREPRRSAAVNGDDENVVVAVAIRGEGQVLAVGAEDGAAIVFFVHGEQSRLAAGRWDEPDIAEVAERDGFTVGRKIRRACELNRRGLKI